MKLNPLFSFVILALVLISMNGCANITGNDEEETIKVVASILPQAEFITAVAGDSVDIEILLPPGANPATYELKPSQLKNIEDADVYFMIGSLPFEIANKKRLEQINPDLRIIDTSKDIEKRTFSADEEHDHEEGSEDDNGENYDPHTWLSPKNAITQVKVIEETLVDIDADNTSAYEENAEQYITKLQQLHTTISRDINESSKHTFMVFHPSWGYFADEYGLEQIAIEQELKEPTPKHIQETIEFAKENNIEVIFVQEQFDINVAKSIAQEVGMKVVSIDPLAKNYIDNLQRITEAFTSTDDST